jgi:GNAT superfamily N-acetyltransferase
MASADSNAATANPDDVILGPFEASDLDSLVTIMTRTWYDNCSSEVEARWLAADEALSYLEVHTFSCAARRDGELLGLALARHGSPATDERARWQAVHEERHAEKRDGAERDQQDGGEGPSVYAEEMAAYGSILDERGMADDDCLSLLVVSPDARGLGLGRRLVDAAGDYLRRQGATTLHLVTDTTCDWPFYEHLGLERLGARPGSGGTTHPDEYFLYGTRL